MGTDEHPAAPGLSGRLLVADDSTTIRKIVELAFRDSGIEVDTAASGDEALRTFAARAPDVVLVDVALPEPNGYELCRQVKHSERPVPVLLLAGAFEPLDRELAQVCGADDHLVKPFDSRALVERVAALLAPRPDPAPPIEPATASVSLDPRSAPAQELPVQVAIDSAPTLGQADLDQLARLVAQRLSLDVVREIAREVVPRVAADVVRERIREIEREGS